MAIKRPLALYSGVKKELQTGDVLPSDALGFTPENVSNKISSFPAIPTADQYPNAVISKAWHEARVPYTGASDSLHMGGHAIEARGITGNGYSYYNDEFIGSGLNDGIFVNDGYHGEDTVLTVEIDSAGQLETFTTNAQGTGYTTNFTGTVVQTGGSGATLQCGVSGGKVTSATWLSGGNGYHAQTAVTVSGGSGTGFKINITAVKDTFKWFSTGYSVREIPGYIQKEYCGIKIIGGDNNHDLIEFNHVYIRFENALGHKIGDKWVMTITTSDAIISKDAYNQIMLSVTNSGFLNPRVAPFGQMTVTSDGYDMADAPSWVKYFFFQPLVGGNSDWDIFTPDPGARLVQNRFKEIWVNNRTMAGSQNLTLNLNNNTGSYGSGGRFISPDQDKRGNKLVLTYGQSVAMVSTLHIINFLPNNMLAVKWCWMVTMAPVLQPS
jgi:hypothetical protein